MEKAVKNKPAKLLIRADANAAIGTGHVMRCLALAQACQTRGVDVQFACVECTEGIRQRIMEEGVGVVSIDGDSGSSDDSTALLALAEEYAANWIVLDGYQFGIEYQKRVRGSGYSLLVIDDYAHLEEYHADVLLNQNLGATADLYPHINPDCQMLLGPKFALLRKEFWPWREWQRDIPEKAENLLVMMGGSDPDGVTLKILAALASLPNTSIHLRVVVGAANQRSDEIVKTADALPMKVEVLRNVQNMPELLAWADLAVSAAGSTCWELMFMGVPTLTVVLADNQWVVAEPLDSTGLSINLGEHKKVSTSDVCAAVSSLISDPNRRRQMIIADREQVDGMGAERVFGMLRRYLS